MEELDNLDQIVANTETSTNQEIPMESHAPETPQQTQTPAQESFFEFTSNGQQVKIPSSDPRVKQWLERGYSAPNQIGKLNQELNQWKTKASDYETRFKSYEPYEKVDQWAKANPQQWQSLINNWQSALSSGAVNQNQVPPEIMQKLQGLEDKFQTIEQEKQLQREQTADHSLDSEIQSIRQQYSNLDFGDPRDANSLEMQIISHGIQNGIPSFKAAFRDYCHDQLVKLAEEKGKETVGKSLQKTQRLGLQGKSPAPQSQGKALNLKSMNYDQLEQAALAELGLA